MSSFKIYKFDSTFPERTIKINRLLSQSVGIILPVSIVLSNFSDSNIIKWALTISGFTITVFLLVWFYVKLKNLKPIGILKISVHGFEKNIGDYLGFKSFEKLKSIIVCQYYPAVFHFLKRDGIHSYVVKFIFEDSPMECFLLSNDTLDSTNFSVLDNLKFLEKKGVKLEIK